MYDIRKRLKHALYHKRRNPIEQSARKMCSLYLHDVHRGVCMYEHMYGTELVEYLTVVSSLRSALVN